MRRYAGLTMTSFLGSCLSHAGAYLRDETAADPAWAWLRLSPLTFASRGRRAALEGRRRPFRLTFKASERRHRTSRRGRASLLLRYAVLLGALVALLLLASPSFHDFVPAEKSAQTAPAALEEGAARAADRRHANLVWTGLVLNATAGAVRRGAFKTRS